MSTLNHPSDPYSRLTARGELRCFRSDAAVGEVALIVTLAGRRMARIELPESLATTDLVERVMAWAMAQVPPMLTVHDGGASGRS